MQYSRASHGEADVNIKININITRCKKKAESFFAVGQGGGWEMPSTPNINSSRGEGTRGEIQTVSVRPGILAFPQITQQPLKQHESYSLNARRR